MKKLYAKLILDICLAVGFQLFNLVITPITKLDLILCVPLAAIWILIIIGDIAAIKVRGMEKKEHDWKLIYWMSGVETYECTKCHIQMQKTESIWNKMS